MRAGPASRLRPKGVAFAFSANRSQRSPNLRRSAATSGELANFARRTHSAAWAWQYITYEDITRPQPRGRRRRLHLFARRRWAIGEYSMP
jgi:hypothetical protein